MSVAPRKIHETLHYTVQIVKEPKGNYECYGVVNREFGVTEAYISNLARARQVADQFEHDLVPGNTRPPGSGGMQAALAEALGYVSVTDAPNKKMVN